MDTNSSGWTPAGKPSARVATLASILLFFNTLIAWYSIDKKSSAELSEAINSMFQWYQGAVLCYVYLQGVSWADERAHLEWQFSSDAWWTRGWTLQELLAPSELLFYTKEWRFLGTKVNRIEEIHSRTGIAREYLSGEQSLSSASIATRMSWAAARVTERKEDAAYSLLGIFDVHMPLLYGEGSRAFHRLQEEIMRSSDDQSLFAWRQSSNSLYWEPHGLLADSPAAFEDSGGIMPYSDWQERAPSTSSSRGIHLQLGFDEAGVDAILRGDLAAQASLLCRPAGQENGFVTIWLHLPTNSCDSYARTRRSDLTSRDAYGDPRELYVLHDARAVRGMWSTALSPFRSISLTLSARALSGAQSMPVWILQAPNGGAEARFTTTEGVSRCLLSNGTVNAQTLRLPRWRQGPEVMLVFEHALPERMTYRLTIMIGTCSKSEIAFDANYLDPTDVDKGFLSPRFDAVPLGGVKVVRALDAAHTFNVCVHKFNDAKDETLEIDISELKDPYAAIPSDGNVGGADADTRSCS